MDAVGCVSRAARSNADGGVAAARAGTLGTGSALAPSGTCAVTSAGCASGGGGALIQAALAVGDTMGNDRAVLDERKRALTAERRQVAGDIAKAERKRHKLMIKSQGLSTDDLVLLLGRAAAKAHAKASPKPNAKAKAKAKAKATPSPDSLV